ncbi:EAL domain-containing protein [Kineosporia sp. J2-2]|uniref:EAL domain-containing protein n=1 Tax=Kineosporia corallincola TaxID=2835133 RepID=A0ABS5TFW6_9ACTN|nr:EAL domain-containing protein [Kineosporia corallincola]MBT0769748.1 EAL domain-containing protein [Kineosporia corallincola]
MTVVQAMLMAAAAALAGVAWARAIVRTRRLLTPTAAAAGLCWALGSVPARLLDPSSSLPAGQIADFLMVVAAAGLLTAHAAMGDRIVPVRRPGIGVAEAVVLALAAATVAWVVVGAPLHLPASTAFALLPAVLDLVSLLVVLRLPTRTPAEPAGYAGPEGNSAPGRSWGLLVTALTAVLLSDLLRGTRVAGAQLPSRPEVSDAVLAPVACAAGLLLALYSLRLTRNQPPTERSDAEPADDVRHLPRRRGRLVPYGVALAAPVAVGAQATVTGTGPIPLFGLGCLAAAFVVWQTLLLLEQDELLRRQVEARKRLALLVENTSDLLLRLDTNGRILAVNAAATRLLHRPPSSIAQRPFEELARPDDQRRVREAVLEVTRGHRDAAEIELLLAPPAAGTAQLRLRGVDGGAVANLNDVTDSVELRQRLERLARFDQMTGLANRAHLLDEVGTWLLLARPAPGDDTDEDSGIAVLYADLDGFKAVNDRFGHAAGDRVLVDVAARLDAVAGAVDARRVIVSRVGGDEFILAMEGVGRAAATTAAQRLVEAIAPPFRVGGRTVQLGVSVGVAYTDPTDGDPRIRPEREGPAALGDHPAGSRSSAATLVHRADLAMYAAKSDGRARHESWRPELEEQVRRRVDLAIGLRDALERGHLAVAYQPIVRLADGHVQGVEALLRLPPDQAGFERDGVVSPAELVEIAEDTGAITELGEWVLRQAVTQAAGWARRGHQISVSVNMSVAQLVSPAFVELVTGMLDATGLPPSRLVLELTESQLVEHSGPAPDALQALRDAGIRLAIDDFGTGYSSLSYLRRMPVSLVKIDRSLLAGLGTDPRAAALLSAVVSMARGLDLSVVAEGMEDLATARALRDLGVQAGQGFAFSRALPAAEIRRLLAGGPLDIEEPAGEPGGELGDDGEPAPAPGRVPENADGPPVLDLPDSAPSGSLPEERSGRLSK